MRTYLFLYVCLLPYLAIAQNESRFSIVFQATPEMTFHLNNYAYRWQDTYTVSTLNCGFQTLLQYDFTKKLFVESGLGYIPRTIKSTVFFNQAAIPPPRQSFTEELVHATQVSYRILQLPLTLGINLVTTPKIRFYINGGITGNFLLDAHYDTAKKYEGTYEKKVWQGHSILLGTGIDFLVFKTLWMTTGVSYSVVNTVKKDPYLDGQDTYSGLALTHSYLNLLVGVKIPLKK